MSFKNAIVRGTIILTLAGFATRIIGFFNRIFLSKLIGARELGIYQLIFPIYLFAFSFCCQGIQTALVKIISAKYSKKNNKEIKSFLKAALFLSLSLGFICSLIIFSFSKEISIYILNSEECSKCLKILSFAIPFISIKGCLHGYFLGIEKSEVPAMAQFIEQIFRVLSIYLLSFSYIFPNGLDASIAVLGLVLGECASCIYTIFSFFYTQKSKNTFTNFLPSINSFKELLRDCIPLTTNRMALTGLQSLESILIPSMLVLFYNNSDLSLELYGILTGMSMPFIMFPATITTSLSVMLLPAVSSAKALDNNNSIKKITEKSIQYCLLVGILSTFIFIFFGKALGTTIFNNETSGELLFSLSLLCPFIYLSTTNASILNGLGKTNLTLFYNIIGIGIRIAFILLAIPSLGIKGYLYGLLSSYLLLVFLEFSSIRKMSNINFEPLNYIVLPSLWALGFGFLSKIIYQRMLIITSPFVSLISSLVIFLIFYLLFVYETVVKKQYYLQNINSISK